VPPSELALEAQLPPGAAVNDADAVAALVEGAVAVAQLGFLRRQDLVGLV
jgi:hypothetical protein